MIKNIKLFSLFSLSLILFLSCSRQNSVPKIKITSTIFPYYDWVSNVLGDEDITFSNSLIIKNGQNIHQFKPSQFDISQIQNSDIIIFTGSSQDSWIESTINSSEKPIKSINIIKNCNITTLKSDENESDTDEHIWLSMKNAQIICTEIFNTLCTLSPENTDKYKRNLDDYIKKLQELNDDYSKLSEYSKNIPLFICDVFPFKYLIDEYNIPCYSAFSGCSNNDYTQCNQIDFLTNKLSDTKIAAIYITDLGTDNLARKILVQAKTNNLCDILVLDSMQTTTLREAFNGKTYIQTMKKNFDNILKAYR